jgi:hypothetical protein
VVGGVSFLPSMSHLVKDHHHMHVGRFVVGPDQDLMSVAILHELIRAGARHTVLHSRKRALAGFTLAFLGWNSLPR